MPDARFYDALGPASLGELADLTGAELALASEAGRAIDGVAPLARAGAHEITFLHDRRHLGEFERTRAAACFARPEYAGRAPAGCVVLVARQPQAAFARTALRLHRPRRHEGAEAVHPEAELEPGVSLASGVVIGRGARIGEGTEIGPNAVIGPGVAIGRRCRIGAGATIGFALIGDEVRIYAGVVIGEAGFGVAAGGEAMVDVPQLGRVIIQDRVTVGANSCIDRGAWDDTVIGENTKIDNLVQIAHNVSLGRNCVMAAQTGISGSVTVGDGVMFGGRVGIADHLKVGAGARIAAFAGIMHNVPAGEVWAGVPAKPIRRFMRETAWLGRMAQERGDQGRGEAGSDD